MVKTYLRYEAAGAFGVIVSPTSNIIPDSQGKLLICPALEDVVVWNLKQGLPVKTLQRQEQQLEVAPLVTALSISPSPSPQVSVGYSSGNIRLWNYINDTHNVVFNGHKSAVSVLVFNTSGSLLASGGKDTDIVVWDVVGEVGICRQLGHRDQVTGLSFVQNDSLLISSSLDTCVRVWDLDTKHCIQTVVGHHCQIWSLAVDPLQQRLVTGAADSELRLFEINAAESLKGQEKSTEVLKPMGSIQRQNGDRVLSVEYNKEGTLLLCQVAGKTVELYRVRDAAEVKRHVKRRRTRKKTQSPADGAEKEASTENPTTVASDELVLLQVLRVSHKIRSAVFCSRTGLKTDSALIALSLHNNSIQVHQLSSSAGDPTSDRVHCIELPGHRADIRSLCLSPDSSLLISCSHNAVKVWNPATNACLRTVDTGYALSSLLVPGDKQAVIGCKDGQLQILDVYAGELLRTIPAHSGAVWAMAALPDGSGLVTGSADQTVKFWEYELLEEGETGPQLSLACVRTLKLTEDVLCVRISRDGKHIACALLDSTIKVYFADTLKFFLSLYGHKLPVLCCDISSDGTLLASGSADKNIKLWGLDFGDCHRSMFAHADSVTCLQFVPSTHYLFSASKDGVVKYWDGDRGDQLLALHGHQGPVWALTVSRAGDLVFSGGGGQDRSLRRWERTEEPFFVEEEREKQLETLFDTVEVDDHRPRAGTALGTEQGAAETAVEIGVSRRSRESVSAADDILAALDTAEEEGGKQQGGAGPSAELKGLSPAAYVLEAVSKVRPSEIEQAVMSLPLADTLKLVEYLPQWLSDSSKVEITVRVADLVLRMHYSQLVASASSRLALSSLHSSLRHAVQGLKDVIGFNLAAMAHLKRSLLARSDFGDDSTNEKVRAVRSRLVKGRDAVIAEKLAARKKKRKKVESEL